MTNIFSRFFNKLGGKPNRLMVLTGLCLFASLLWLPLQVAGAAGGVDFTFTPGTGANNDVFTMKLQADGKILIGGDFTSYNGTGRTRVARLNTNGTLDATFNPGTGANNGVRAMAVQADGKVLIGGEFSSYNGTARNRIARLNSNGSLDATFNPGAGVDGAAVHSLAIQADGKILIAGNFANYNGTSRNSVARLNSNGSLDATFNPGTGANAEMYVTTVQADGKILIGGDFTTYNGTGRNRIARLNSNGSLDATFNPGTGANDFIIAIAVQADDKILIGGDFNTYNGTGRNRIARLNSNGSLDATFNPGTGTVGWVISIAVQADGKILIGGGFTSYNGTARNRIARLNTNGSLDATFNPGTGANATVWNVTLQADGKVLIGGSFDTVDGWNRSGVARLAGVGGIVTEGI